MIRGDIIGRIRQALTLVEDQPLSFAKEAAQ
jgi:hypothetical protein